MQMENSLSIPSGAAVLWGKQKKKKKKKMKHQNTYGCSGALRIYSKLTAQDEDLSGGRCHSDTTLAIWEIALLTISILAPR